MDFFEKIDNHETKQLIINSINPGSFVLSSDYMVEALEDMYNAINSVDGGWHFMKNNSPPQGQGFMFWKNDKLDEIQKAMKFNGHSGASYACCMREMEYIAKHSWRNYIEETLNAKIKRKDTGIVEYINGVIESKEDAQTPQEPDNNIRPGIDLLDNALKTIDPDSSFKDKLLQFADLAEKSNLPDAQDQSSALRSFANGQMDYATMRFHCG